MTTLEHIAALGALVETYVVAMTRGDRPALERIFFDRASEVGHYEGELLWNSRDAFIAMCEDAADAETDPFWAINSVSVQGNIAQVHVENDWAGMRFDDFLTLLLHEGSWRIVSKVYRIR